MMTTTSAMPLTVFVIDALDECANPEVTGALLQAFITTPLPIKLLITSRPELHIRRSLQPLQAQYITFVLEDVDHDEVYGDIL